MNSKLLQSKHFCMLPWTHMHIWPNGNSYMCCGTDPTKPLGVVDGEHTIKMVWNSDLMKKNRLAMLNNERVPECSKCYEIESLGGTSFRQEANINKGHHVDKIATTMDDGTVPDINMVYMDIRFSNLCNLRCRTCGPELSSRWAQDLPKVIGTHFIKNVSDLSIDFYEQLIEVLPITEHIYFAGGEPLLIDEHYKILQYLIDTNRAKDIELTYNTNFSKLKYKNISVLDLWQHFPRVMVGASLDGYGKQAEYIRKELVWADVESNRKLLKEKCPHVKFFVQVCVSVFNFSTLAETHRHYLESGFIADEVDWNMNMLTDPDYYHVNITSEKYRKEIQQKYIAHVEWLKSTGRNNETCLTRWNSMINFLNGEQHHHNLEVFKRVTAGLDKFRHESFADTFPELTFLLE